VREEYVHEEYVHEEYVREEYVREECVRGRRISARCVPVAATKFRPRPSARPVVLQVLRAAEEMDEAPDNVSVPAGRSAFREPCEHLRARGRGAESRTRTGAESAPAPAA
jgi:hypothetical protein